MKARTAASRMSRRLPSCVRFRQPQTTGAAPPAPEAGLPGSVWIAARVAATALVSRAALASAIESLGSALDPFAAAFPAQFGPNASTFVGAPSFNAGQCRRPHRRRRACPLAPRPPRTERPRPGMGRHPGARRQPFLRAAHSLRGPLGSWRSSSAGQSRAASAPLVPVAAAAEPPSQAHSRNARRRWQGRGVPAPRQAGESAVPIAQAQARASPRGQPGRREAGPTPSLCAPPPRAAGAGGRAPAPP